MASAEREGRLRRLEHAHLYLVIEAAPPGRGLEQVAAAALAGGVDAVQLREKTAGDEAIVRAGRRLRELCRSHGALLVINDRPDLALACGADGVHVGQDDEDLDAVRRRLGDDLLIGISTHSPEQVAAAQASTADYLGVGPVFATATKPAVAPVGLDLVRHAATVAGKPFFAIGGIDPANAGEVAAAGARRIAVVRAIRDAGDPAAAARELRAAVDAPAAAGEEPAVGLFR